MNRLNQKEDSPEEWGQYVLNDLVCDDTPITYGVVQPGPEDPLGVLFIRGGDIFHGKIHVDQLRTISEKVSDTYRRTILNGGELVMSLVGYPGEVAVVPNELRGSNIARQAALIKLRSGICNTYVMYYLLSDLGKYFLFEKSTGSAQQVINLIDLKFVKVILPELPQQKKISKILTTVDKLIEQTQALIDKYTAIKQGMMADLFTRGIDLSGTPETNPNHGQLRPSFEEAPELYKETELGWVPQDWDAMVIGEALEQGFLELIQDGNHGEAYPRSSDFSDDGTPFLSAKHIKKNGSIDFSDCPKLPQSHLRKLRIGFGNNGDVVFAHNATVGPVGIVDDQQKFIASTSTTIYRVGAGLLNMYLFYYLRSIKFQHQVSRVMGQTTRNQVPIGLQKEQKIMVPTIPEQEEMIRILEGMRQKIKEENHSLLKYQKIKKGLMQDLLTGKVRVNA